ncbi:MAG: hypothetical protein NC299_00680 [Lachnospiraceae bacterium]|nr:hypothetical protein [Ruminococcus sp.]MCM1273862.1 hypothetical protein [Lachnospiraceae bacterium]
MKKIVLFILTTVIGAALLLGGGAVGAYMYNAGVPHFDNYEITYFIFGEAAEDVKEMQAENGYGVYYPDFYYCNPTTEDIVDCYAEVEEAMMSYAQYVAARYNNKARLDPEVEYTKTRLTIRFTGTGYLENGLTEPLDRTYIFDIEGAGKNKLPKLLNKAEIYPEIL